MQAPEQFSNDAEQALLGCLLINPDELPSLELKHADFYVQKNRWVYEAMKAISDRRMTPDIITVSEELARQNRLQEIGGQAYLVRLATVATSSLYLETYAEIIRDKSRRRAIIRTASELVQAANGKDAPDEAIMRSIKSLTQSMRLIQGAHPVRDFVSELYDDVLARSQNPQDIFGIPTGLADFDKVTGGLQRSEALYIGGLPGIGKSILAFQMGWGMAANGHPGAIYSMEMRGMQAVRRSVSALATIPTRRLKTGHLEDGDWGKFTQAVETASNLPIYMSDESYITTAGLRADLARLVAMYDIEWFVLDYLYLLSDGSGRMDPTDRTELLSSRIKLLCKEFNLAGITVNSVTKDGADIRGSGQVKHDADIIAMLEEHHADSMTGTQKHDNMRTLVFTKARELANPKSYLHLVKHDEYPAFYDFTPEPNAQRVAKANGNGNGKMRMWS